MKPLDQHPTPLTDAHLQTTRTSPGENLWASADFARDLERKLAQANEEIGRLRKYDSDMEDWVALCQRLELKLEMAREAFSTIARNLERKLEMAAEAFSTIARNYPDHRFASCAHGRGPSEECARCICATALAEIASNP